MLMLKLGKLYCTYRGFDFLASLGKKSLITYKNKTCIPRRFLYSIFEKTKIT